MPRSYLMSWEGHPGFRWVKMHRGQRYRISCGELGLPREQWTREASATAANQWWTGKRAELDAAAHAARPHAAALDELAERERVGKAVNVPASELTELDRERQWVENLPPDISVDALKLHEFGLNPAAVGNELVWRERKRIVGTVPAERTVGVLVDQWLQRRRSKYDAGDLTVSGAAQSKYRIEPFKAFIGGASSVDTLNAARWEDWHVHLSGRVKSGKMSADWAKNQFQTSKQFVRWLWTVEILDNLPRNFDTLKIGGGSAKEIDIYDADTVRAMLDGATPRFRLYLYLMLNCGMYQSDISELRRDQVDLAAGTITRKRVKTKNAPNAPVVTYALWPETVAIFRQEMSGEREYALLNEDGKQLVRERLKPDGTHTKTDAIRQAFDRLKEKVGVAGTIKQFRKTSASLLKTRPEFERLAPYFLGHAPRTTSDRHYAKDSDERLAVACGWLRAVYLTSPL